MNRRTVIKFLYGAFASVAANVFARAISAQEIPRVRRIGLLMAYRQSDRQMQDRVAAFRHGLREAGWIDGQNVRIDVRWLDGETERAKNYAKELVDSAPDVIVVNGTPGTAAVRQLTSSIPIVFVIVTDPVGAGFVSNLSRPGGNVTGFSTFEPEVGGKWLELLKEAAPGVSRAGVLMDPEFRGFFGHWLAIESLAPSLGIQAIALHGRTGPEIERAIAQFGGQENGGLIILPTPINSVERRRIFSLATQHRLPAIYPFTFAAKNGGLMAYGFDAVDLFRRAAPYAARILNGEKPGDLPVQAPTKYSLVVNMKTAKAQGISIPPSILFRADEVIE